MSERIKQLEQKALDIRKTTLDVCIKAGTGHVTSSMSCIDIMVALYYGDVLRVDPQNPEWEGRDRFILSKGQASPALYTILADKGFYGKENLNGFAQKGGMFGVHLQHSVPGVEITTGSLGQGLGVAAGIALGAKMSRELYLTISLIGDGECYEGSVWETAMFASHHKLNNLVFIMDRNYLCATDFTENLIELGTMEDKWLSFGWDVKRVDGHNMAEIMDSLQNLRNRKSTKPLIIIADCVKGQGIESMSNIPLWHGAAPKGDFAEQCKSELHRRYSND
jgi:transketolase